MESRLMCSHYTRHFCSRLKQLQTNSGHLEGGSLSKKCFSKSLLAALLITNFFLTDLAYVFVVYYVILKQTSRVLNEPFQGHLGWGQTRQKLK